MSQEADARRRSAEAMIATFLQMSRHATLAHRLQRVREQATARRIDKATDPRELARLRRQLDAQQTQAAVIQNALDRFQGRAPDLAGFAAAGLTFDDFQRFGLGHVVKREDVEKARKEGKAKGGGAGGHPGTWTGSSVTGWRTKGGCRRRCVPLVAAGGGRGFREVGWP